MFDLSSRSKEARTAEYQQLSQAVDAAITQGDFTTAFDQSAAAAQRYEATHDREGQALTFYLLGKCYRRLNDFPNSLKYHQESYERYQALHDTLGSANALQAKAGTLRILGRNEEAIRDLMQSRKTYREIGERAQEMRTLMNLSIIHKQSGDVAAAQTLLYECLAFFEQSEQTSSTAIDTAKVLLNIATNYNVLNDLTEAIRFATRGIPLFEAAGDLHNLSMARCVLGASYLKQNDDETALEQFRIALQIAEQVNIGWVIAIILDDISKILMHQKRFDEAREILERCLSLNGENDNRLVYCGNRAQMGYLYAHPEYSERDEEKALTYLLEAQQKAEEQEAVMLLTEIYNSLTDLHERRGDFPQALASFRALYAVEKRLFNEESDQRIKQLEIEKAQKDAEIARLRMVELAQALEEAERLRELADQWARTDSLTGLLNRRALDELLDEEYLLARSHEHPFTVALIDIDYFKKINDNLGHGVGDNTIYQVARLLQTHGRSGDHIARYGGEEFALVFPATDLPDALTLCERLRTSVEEYDWTTLHPHLPSVTISVGISLFDKENRDRMTSPMLLLAEADKNLYRAKRGGRNRVMG